MKKLFLITGLMFAFVGLAEAQLASPTLLKPDNAARLPLNKAAKFTWQKVTGASKYRLIFSNDKSFANYDANKFKCLNAKTCFMYTVASPSYNVAATHALLKIDGNYFWQVQSVGKTVADNSKKGEIRSFVVGNSNKYVKIANDGSELPNTAKLGAGKKDWACTKDNETGLIWEVKTTDGGLRDWNNKYTNYTADYPKCDEAAYGWMVGGVGVCNNYGFTGKYGDSTNADGFVMAVNTQSLCGNNDWRLPTNEELISLVYCSDGKYNKLTQKFLDSKGNGDICTSNESGLTTTSPTINTMYFPNTQDYWFWSSSSIAGYSYYAWSDHFYDGYSNGYSNKDESSYVRLVR